MTGMAAESQSRRTAAISYVLPLQPDSRLCTATFVLMTMSRELEPACHMLHYKSCESTGSGSGRRSGRVAAIIRDDKQTVVLPAHLRLSPGTQFVGGVRRRFDFAAGSPGRLCRWVKYRCATTDFRCLPWAEKLETCPTSSMHVSINIGKITAAATRPVACGLVSGVASGPKNRVCIP